MSVEGAFVGGGGGGGGGEMSKQVEEKLKDELDGNFTTGLPVSSLRSH